ncbi:hypothetical protein AB2T90_12005 [Clostridium butyricum]|uniref:hypothetical protein n=1 Tax=Clostridium butyricum TaxID=1492 RepID=UPI0034677C72
MLKFLVIMLFICKMSVFLNGYPIQKYVFSNMGKSLSSPKDLNNLNEEEKQKIGLSTIILIIDMIVRFILNIIEYIVIICVIKYDSTYICVSFLIYTILKTIYYTIKNKVTKALNNKNKTLEESMESFKTDMDTFDKMTLTKFINRTIDILYWSYVVYMLFIV